MNHHELTEYLADREVKYPEVAARMIANWMQGESLKVIAERQNIDPGAAERRLNLAAVALGTNRSVWGSPASVRDALLFSSIQHAQQRLDEMHRAGIVRFGRPLDSKGRVRWGVTLCV